MPPSSSSAPAQNVRVVVRLPYNRPINPEEQIVDPPRVEWGPEKADILWKVIEKSRASDSGGADWKGLAAHLQVPLPYLLYRVHARYQEDLRGLQDIPGVSSPLSPFPPSGTAPWDASTMTTATSNSTSTTATATATSPQTPRATGKTSTLARLNTKLSPSAGIGGGSNGRGPATPLGIRARLNSIGHREPSSAPSGSISLRQKKGVAALSSSMLLLQTPIARKNTLHLSPLDVREQDRRGTSASALSSASSSEDDEMDSDDDEMLKEEEAERAVEEQEALDKKLADLQNMMTGDMLGLVSIGRKQGRRMGQSHRRDLSASAGAVPMGEGRNGNQNQRTNRTHHYNASLSSHSTGTSQSASSAGSPQGSLPEIPSPQSPQSPQSRSPLRRHMSPSKSSSPPTLSPRTALGQAHHMFGHGYDRDGSEASTGSFSDISDASLSGSALDSALLSNTRGNGSRFSAAFARSANRFGTSHRNGLH